MPQRGTRQDLRNFEAMSHGLEPLVVVNAELLFGNTELGRADTLRAFVNVFGQKRSMPQATGDVG